MSMKPQVLLFWIIVGLMISILIILFTNEILTNMMSTTVTVNT